MEGKRIRHGDRVKIPIDPAVPSRNVRRNRARFTGGTGRDGLPYAVIFAPLTSLIR